jgi:hypothetical protein
LPQAFVALQSALLRTGSPNVLDASRYTMWVDRLDQILQIKNITCVYGCASGCAGSDAQQTRISNTTTTTTTTKPQRRRTAFSELSIRLRSCSTRFTGLCAGSSRVRFVRSRFGAFRRDLTSSTVSFSTPTRPYTAPSPPASRDLLQLHTPVSARLPYRTLHDYR